jgi:hypothetical protein
VRELSCRHEVGDYRQRQRVADLSRIGCRSQITEAKLRAAMTSQHGGRMPDFSLSKQEQDDLIGYIFSLRTK